MGTHSSDTFYLQYPAFHNSSWTRSIRDYKHLKDIRGKFALLECIGKLCLSCYLECGLADLVFS